MFLQKNGDFYFFYFERFKFNNKLSKLFAWKNIKTCLRGKIEGLNKEANYY